MYSLLRRILFFFDPEQVHYFSMNLLQGLCRIPVFRKIMSLVFTPKQSPVSFKGLEFRNPVGLAAGFDKNARYLLSLQALGFGFVEIGTITPLPQVGNEKPRLFRLPKDKALINRMGFNNDGMEVVVERMKAWRKKHSAASGFIIGGNIGKNKATPNEEAWMDYEKCFLALVPYVDYFVVNVSSPNTPGLREWQEKESLRKILAHLQGLNQKQVIQRPILLKIAPDLTTGQVDDVISLALEIHLDGLVVANTTISREGLGDVSKKEMGRIGAGGLSGAPLRQRSTELLQYISQKTAGKLPIIGSGGIFTASDAIEKQQAGASLIQVWTGFIYKGPGIVKQILKN